MTQETSSLDKPKIARTIHDLWESFEDKDSIPGSDLKSKKKTFLNTIKIFNSLILKTIVETGETISLPKRSGFLSVRKTKTDKKKFSFAHFRKTGEIKYYKRATIGEFNRVHFKYVKDGQVGLPFGGNYKFKPVKHAKIFLATSINNNPFLINKYYE